MKKEQRFIDRIGKRIYRNETTCTCDTYKEVTENGIIVTDEQHAQYLFDCECDMDIEYRDKK